MPHSLRDSLGIEHIAATSARHEIESQTMATPADSRAVIVAPLVG
jgi:hypothetical protein